MTKQEILDRIHECADFVDELLALTEAGELGLARKLIANQFNGLAVDIECDESDEPADERCDDPECCQGGDEPICRTGKLRFTCDGPPTTFTPPPSNSIHLTIQLHKA